MILPQVSVRLHTECAAILMPKPARHSRNIDSALDADRGEKMTKIVMSYAPHADLGCCAIHRFLRFANKENGRVVYFLRAFVSQPLQQRTQLGNHRNATHFTVLCSCNRVSANGDLGSVKIDVALRDTDRFRKSTAAKRDELNKICAVS